MAGRRERSNERGSALIVALLVMVIMTLLGIPFLLMGETENRIAENERLSLQALYAAESGAQMVVRWFDRPMAVTNVDNPPLGAIDRSLRRIDEDGDPGTAPIQADGSVDKPWYKQSDDAVFDKPYRGSLVDALLGTEDGPDMRIDENGSAAAKNFLEELSEKLFTGSPAAGSGTRTGISRIDVFAPPYVQKGGTWTRFGAASVKVTARIYQERPDGSRSVLAERSVRFVLNEVPYVDGVSGTTGVSGPLFACRDIFWIQNPLGVHWGTAMAGDDAHLGGHELRTVSLPRAVESSVDVDLLWAFNDDDAWDSYYENTVEAGGFRIEDPWFRLMANDDIKENMTSVGGGQQPWPFDWDSAAGVQSGDPTAHNHDPLDPSLDGNHSNLFQHMAVPNCQDATPFPYEMWKALALEGGRNIHYYVWDTASQSDLFLENGEGTPKTVREFTDGKVGFFFFDTRDGLPPAADGSNLTPGISMAGGSWGVRGLIYLNAISFHAHDVVGPNVPYRSPGEPFQDENQNGQWDAGERWVNLDLNNATYNAAAADDFGGGGSVVRNDRGPVVNAPAMIWGVLYNSGNFDSTGNGAYYGAVVVGTDVEEASAVMDSPDIYWDASLSESWPPPEWGLPRVVMTRWETGI